MQGHLCTSRLCNMDAAACKDGYCVSLSLGTHNRVVGVVLGGLDDETDKGLPMSRETQHLSGGTFAQSLNLPFKCTQCKNE